MKSVKIRVVLEVPHEVPEDWGADEINFHLNESSWCANSILPELERLSQSEGCLCAFFKGEYVGDWKKR